MTPSSQISNDAWYICLSFLRLVCLKLFRICLPHYFRRMAVNLLCFVKGNMPANKHLYVIRILEPDVHAFLILWLGVHFSDVTSSLCSGVRATRLPEMEKAPESLNCAPPRRYSVFLSPCPASGLDCSGLLVLTSRLASRWQSLRPPPPRRDV